MRKQLLVVLMGLVYLVFSCSGYVFAHQDFRENAVHFGHLEPTPDDHHSGSPAKSAIKAFFSKTDLKARQFQPAGYFSFTCSPTAVPRPAPVKFYYREELADPRSDYLFHCNLLL